MLVLLVNLLVVSYTRETNQINTTMTNLKPMDKMHQIWTLFKNPGREMRSCALEECSYCRHRCTQCELLFNISETFQEWAAKHDVIKGPQIKVLYISEIGASMWNSKINVVCLGVTKSNLTNPVVTYLPFLILKQCFKAFNHKGMDQARKNYKRLEQSANSIL